MANKRNRLSDESLNLGYEDSEAREMKKKFYSSSAVKETDGGAETEFTRRNKKEIFFLENCRGLFEQYIESINSQIINPFLDPNTARGTKDVLMMEYLRRAQVVEDKYNPPTSGIGNNRVMMMGSNDCGQIAGYFHAGGKDLACSTPKNLRGLAHEDIVQVACGGLHNVARSRTGRAYTWGSSDNGALGHPCSGGDQNAVGAPLAVENLIPSREALVIPGQDYGLHVPNEDNYIVMVSAGDIHTTFLTIFGTVYTTGGYRDEDQKHFHDIPPPDQPSRGGGKILPDLRGARDVPQQVWTLPGKVWFIASGSGMNAAILENDELYTWGMDSRGELGRGVTEENRKQVLTRINNPDGSGYQTLVNEQILKDRFLTPKPVSWPQGCGQMKVLSVSCGFCHMMVAARKCGSGESLVYSCGLNNYGQLGLGHRDDCNTLQLVEWSRDKEIAAVACGMFHTLMMDFARLGIYACGRADEGALGLTREMPAQGEDQISPERISFPPPKDSRILRHRFQRIVCGGSTSFAITNYGEMFVWGLGDLGNLGIGERNTSFPVLLEGKIVLGVGGGSQHSCILVDSGMAISSNDN